MKVHNDGLTARKLAAQAAASLAPRARTRKACAVGGLGTGEAKKPRTGLRRVSKRKAEGVAAVRVRKAPPRLGPTKTHCTQDPLVEDSLDTAACSAVPAAAGPALAARPRPKVQGHPWHQVG